MIIPYGKQNITEEDLNAVEEALKSNFLTQGPKIEEFEKKFSEYVGAKYAVAVSNGTAALHLCALALNVNEKTNVITTPITFAASANCVRYCNGNVFFTDIDPETVTIDLFKLEKLIESKPKGFFSGIIPVDFAGFAVNMEKLHKIAKKHDLWIIEDACHAPGGFFIDSNGIQQNCGSCKFSDLAIFSFHPVKHIACGEGGMITTNNYELYKKLLKYRTHGITRDPDLLIENHGGWYYEMQDLGYNYRLTDFQAALGISQLSRAFSGIKRRSEIAINYNNFFKNKKYILRQSGLIEGHAYHLYIIQVDKRKELYDYLKNKDIHCQVHYYPVHLMPYYKNFGFNEGDFLDSEEYYKKCLSLPMYPTLSESDQDRVMNLIHNFYNK